MTQNNKGNFLPVIGDLLQHKKKGSEYEVMGLIKLNLYGKYDEQEVYICSHHGQNNFYWEISQKPITKSSYFVFPVMLQFDIKNPSPYEEVPMVLYRSLSPKSREPWMFLRPVKEFTVDRFEILNREYTVHT